MVSAGKPSVAIAGVTITTPGRPIYPALEISKGDLAEYYATIADAILPYIAGRPLTLLRCEKGVSSRETWRDDCKFLRHEPGYHRWASAAIERVHIHEQKKTGEYLVVRSREGLVSLVQGDIIEIHCWNSTTEHLEQPDRFVFDFDPSPEVTFPRLVEAASLLREKLLGIGLESWPKLSGGKGLHVVVPFRPELAWAETYEIARLIADAVVREDPGALTMAFEKANRKGKILVDYKRNHRAAVAVAAYSARAHPKATVSLPVSWEELAQETRADRHTLASVQQRLTRGALDPWTGFWRSRQRLTPADGAVKVR
jgi:bifunctional non-homologous end joining protein LigD